MTPVRTRLFILQNESTFGDIAQCSTTSLLPDEHSSILGNGRYYHKYKEGNELPYSS
jgi:hypothetical protein